MLTLLTQEIIEVIPGAVLSDRVFQRDSLSQNIIYILPSRGSSMRPRDVRI